MNRWLSSAAADTPRIDDFAKRASPLKRAVIETNVWMSAT